MRSSALLTTLCHPRVRWSIFALVLLCCVAVYLASLIVDDLAETRSVFLSVSPSGRCVPLSHSNITQFQRPDISPFKVSVDQIDPELLSAGYFFLSPYQSDRGIPHIYDNDGVCVERQAIQASTDMLLEPDLVRSGLCRTWPLT